MKLTAIDRPAHDADLFLLAQILNGAWGRFHTTTPAELARRFASGQLFIVVRDRATPEELDYIRANYGIDPPDATIPIGLLETIDAVTAGDPRKIPTPFAHLTAGGAWRAPLYNADTLVFVDLTTATSRQKSGIGRDIVRFALTCRKPHHVHVFTFTPNVDAIVAWHLKRGAARSGVILANARPGHSEPDVAVMDYSAATPDSVG
jgi:hypothetical protein